MAANKKYTKKKRKKTALSEAEQEEDYPTVAGREERALKYLNLASFVRTVKHFVLRRSRKVLELCETASCWGCWGGGEQF